MTNAYIYISAVINGWDVKEEDLLKLLIQCANGYASRRVDGKCCNTPERGVMFRFHPRRAESALLFAAETASMFNQKSFLYIDISSTAWEVSSATLFKAELGKMVLVNSIENLPNYFTHMEQHYTIKR